MGTAAAATIFSRKLLMNFGFPPLTPWEMCLTSVETILGITLYSLRTKNNLSSFFSVCVYKFQPFLAVLLFPPAASCPALVASPAREYHGVAAALDVLKEEHATGTRPSRIVSDELIISPTCSARLSANTH